MKPINSCSSAVKTLFVCILLACVLVLQGCPKKETQQPPAPEPNQPPAVQKVTGQAPAVPQTPTAVKPPDINKPVPLAQRKKPLLPQGPNTPAVTMEPKILTLDQFAKLTSSDEKVEWISDFADANPQLIPAMVEKALDDPDVEVRSAAMDALVDNEVPNAVGAVSKALKDSEEQIRELAVEACQYVDDKQAAPLLVEALNDPGENVRTAAVTAVGDKKPETKAVVYKAGIVSPHDDVKEATVAGLVDMSSPQAVDILLEGLKDSNPEIKEEVVSGLSFLIDQEFQTYEQAKSWWNKNKKRFDEELVEKEEEKE